MSVIVVVRAPDRQANHAVRARLADGRLDVAIATARGVGGERSRVTPRGRGRLRQGVIARRVPGVPVMPVAQAALTDSPSRERTRVKRAGVRASVPSVRRDGLSVGAHRLFHLVNVSSLRRRGRDATLSSHRQRDRASRRDVDDADVVGVHRERLAVPHRSPCRSTWRSWFRSNRSAFVATALVQVEVKSERAGVPRPGWYQHRHSST